MATTAPIPDLLTLKRKTFSKPELFKRALQKPLFIQRELNNRSFYEFFQYFWGEISAEPLELNWHIPYLCGELQKVAERVFENKHKLYDLIINISPGTSKTSIVSVMFPVWCWTRNHYMQFITASYSSALSLESAEKSRDLVRSDKFREMYTDLEVKPDKDTKSNFKVIKYCRGAKMGMSIAVPGGSRFSTSCGGTMTGFHGHFLLVDDPLNPNESQSKTILHSTNTWVDQVLSTRKVNKEVTPLIMVMQRINQSDPTGHILSKNKGNVRHICLPGELGDYEGTVNPPELKEHYKNGLFDTTRLPRHVLDEMYKDLGQYGYAGQIGQRPTPPGGGMFKVEQYGVMETVPPPHEILAIVRYWDKAGSTDSGAYTVGVKMAKLDTGKYLIMDVRRGQWSSEVREKIIRQTADNDRTTRSGDGGYVRHYVEQEPGSGGKESAQATVVNLAGHSIERDLPRGDKVFRADPYSVQVNNGNVVLLRADWNHEFIEEHRFFPFSKYKDQVDAAGAAFSKLNAKKQAKAW